jgi:hypothetical protein
MNAVSRCCRQSTPAHPQVHSATGPMVAPRSWPARNFRAFLGVVMWSSMSPLSRHPLSRPALLGARADAPTQYFERDDRRTPGRARTPGDAVAAAAAHNQSMPSSGECLPASGALVWEPTAGLCESDRGEWGELCPACGRPLPPQPRPLRSWHAARAADGLPRAGVAHWRGAADAIWPSPGRATMRVFATIGSGGVPRRLPHSLMRGPAPRGPGAAGQSGAAMRTGIDAPDRPAWASEAWATRGHDCTDSGDRESPLELLKGA